MSYPTLCIACGHARTLHDGPEGVCVGNCTSLEPLVQCGCAKFIASEAITQRVQAETAEARLTALEAENTRLRMRAALKTQNAEQATSRIATLEAENARLLDALTAHAARTIMDALKIPL